jgi:methionyl-tRNA formyltransferase
LATVFLGTSEFAAAVLARLADSPHRPALVLTRPDRPRGRGRRSAPPPVAERARELGLALAQPDSVNDPEARELIARSAGGGRQTLVVCAFGALIKEPLLSEHDILNVHPSLLPRWRGAAPLERAIMAGDRETGVSIMRLTAGLDSGPVCLAATEPILPDDTYGSLAPRLAALSGEVLVRALEQAPPFAEQPSEGVTYAEKIGPGDRLLDPRRPAVELERVVRALHPHIGARAELPNGSVLGIHRAALLGEEAPVAPGGETTDAAGAVLALGVQAVAGRLLLGCDPGILELLCVQPPGGRPMDAAAYLRGHAAPGRR